MYADKSRARSCTVADLEDLDIGHRITLMRPRNDERSRPQIRAILRGISRVDYLVGNMRRPGVELRVGYPGRYGGENGDIIGPLPLHHKVEVWPESRRGVDAWGY